MVRLRVHVAASDISKSLARLPASACKRKGALIDYSKKHNTKLAPKWSEVADLCPTLSMLLEFSKGKNILFVSMKAGVEMSDA
jgi:hypothetical protein